MCYDMISVGFSAIHYRTASWLHDVYGMTTLCLRYDCIMITLWLQYVYVGLHYDYIMFTIWLHDVYAMIALWLHYDCMMFTLWLHDVYVMIALWLYYDCIGSISFLLLASI